VPGGAATTGIQSELRIALALNGGVSLAIWIGGVADELLRLVNAGRLVRAGVNSDPSNPYVAICARLGIVPVVDVVTGASAGGLNGVFLALGIVRGHPHLAALRDLWITEGSFEALLRDPTDPAMPSLMKGDEYFLDRLHRAIATLLDRDVVDRTGEPPVHVRMTATSLGGSTVTMPDARGNVLYDTDHRVEFRFDEADFATADTARMAGLLARACRSTASFPGAFEPSRVDALAYGHRLQGVEGNADLVDGGVLVNLPAQHAIDAIVGQASRERVARVLALVVPDPGDAPEPATGTPSITSVLGASVAGIPRVQSLHGFLAEVAQHNLDVKGRRAARDALFANGSSYALLATASALFSAYASNRRTTALEHLDASLRRRLAEERPRAMLAGDEELRARIDAALAPTQDVRAALEHAAAVHGLPFVPDALGVGGRDWCWGATTVTRLVTVLVDLANRAQAHLPPATYRAAKGRLSMVRDTTTALVPGGGVVVETVLARLRAGDDVEAAIGAALAAWPAGRDGDGVAALNEQLVVLGRVARVLARHLPDSTGAGDPLAGFGRMVRACRSSAEAARLLIALEVVELAFAGFAARSEQVIELVQITARPQAPVDLAGRREADAKLAGVQLGHFGAFLKRSWRANDWLWGRLDGSTRLVALLHEAAAGSGAPDDAAVRSDTVDVQAAVLFEELPVLAAQIEADRETGSPPTPAARALLDAVRATSYEPGGPADPRGPNPAEAHRVLRRHLALNQVGAERLNDELGSDLAVRTTVKAVATTATVANRSGPRLLRTPTKLVRSVGLLSWLLVRLTEGQRRTAAVLAGLLLGAGIAVVAVDVFTTADLGALTPIAWVAVAVVVLLGLLRSPLLTVPVLVIGVVPGLLARLGDEPGWWPADVPWPKLPDPFAALSFVAAFVLVGSVRRFTWLDTQVRAVRDELRHLAALPVRPWLRRWRAAWWPGLALVAGTAGLVTVKNLAVSDVDAGWWAWLRWFGERGTGSLVARNGVLALAVVAAVAAVLHQKAWWSALGLPRRHRRDVRATLEAWAAPLVALAASAAALLADGLDGRVRVGLLVAGGIVLAAGARWAVAQRPLEPAEREDLWQPWWNVVPAWLVVSGFAIAGVARDDVVHQWGRLLGVVVGTALAEELIFRGGLQSLAIRTRNLWIRVLVPGLAFGAWHLVDAINDTRDRTWDTTFDVLFVAGTVAATALASWLVLEPLRLRARSIVGPWLLHAAVNGSLLVLGYSSPLA